MGECRGNMGESADTPEVINSSDEEVAEGAPRSSDEKEAERAPRCLSHQLNCMW